MNTSLRILLLEDTADDAELLILLLEQAGYQMEWRRVETEAEYRAALDSAPSLILADYRLPQMTGLAALQIMRQRGLDIPFIIVTGALGDEAAVECMKLGASDYLLKDRLARLPSAVQRALELAKLRAEQKLADERTQQMAFRDALTNLYNRAYFEDALDHLRRGRRFPVSLMMVDVDGLKEINDRHGHAAGDEILRRAARVLEGSLRAEDVLARIGGDEFVALLPNTDDSSVQGILERARQAILHDNLLHAERVLSLSFGAVTVRKEELLVGALPEADAKMYIEKLAKERLRDRSPRLSSYSGASP